MKSAIIEIFKAYFNLDEQLEKMDVNEFHSLKKILDQLNENKKKHESDLTKANKELDKHRGNMDTIVKEKRAAKRQMQKAQQQMQKAQKEMQKAQKLFDRSQNRIDHLDMKLEEIKSHVNAAQDTIQKVQTQRNEDLCAFHTRLEQVISKILKT